MPIATPRRIAAATALALVAAIGVTWAVRLNHGGTPTFTLDALDATIAGTSVTTSATVHASASTTTQTAGVCVRDSADVERTLAPVRNATVRTTAQTFTGTATLEPGSYRYYACVKIGGSWQQIGDAKTFVITGGSGTELTGSTSQPPTTAPTGTGALGRKPVATGQSGAPQTGPGSLSGQPMPTGNLPGWTQIFADDFTAPVPLGQFPGPAYAKTWDTYYRGPDTAHDGFYDTKKTISVANGGLDMFLHTENGEALSSAVIPLQNRNGKWGGQSYGRYSVRFKSDPLPGYGVAWLLWPDGNDWNRGEIDFPEGKLSSTVDINNHCPGNPRKNCYHKETGLPFTGGWHTATIEWTPQALTFFYDGVQVGRTTTNIPSQPMHWVLQSGTNGGKPAANVSGHIVVDWAVIYRYTP